MITLVEDSLAKFNTTVSTLMGRVKDIDKRIQELGSMQNMEQLRGELQATMNSVVVDFNNEI